jgi:biopolymer transport protein ExbB
MMRVLLLFFSIMLSLAGAEQSVLQRAQATQQLAEQARAEVEQRIVSERQQLQAQAQQLQAELAELRRQRQQQQQQLTESRQEQQELQQQAATADQHLQQAATVCGVLLAEAMGTTFERMHTALNQRLDRLAAALALRIDTDQLVYDRSGGQRQLPIVRLGAVQALAAGSKATSSGFLRQEPGVPVIAGPALPAPARDGLRQAVAGQLSLLPCDPSASLVAQQAIEAWSVGRWFAAGGVFVWPILAVVLTALILALERLVALARLRSRPRLARLVLQELEAGRPDQARALLPADGSPMTRLLRAGLEHLNRSREACEAALEAALLAEQPRFERSLQLLAALAGVAPLLGLLGTVTGMIGTFHIIAVQGTGNPHLLSGGISEALVTTQMGLLAAVPILLLHAILGRAIDRRQVLLEQTAASLLACQPGRVA